MGGFVHTTRTFYDPGGQAAVAEADLPITRHPPFGFGAIVGQLTARGDVSQAATVIAYINESRWIASCPFCNSAQVGSPDDPRFLCANCANLAVQGAYLNVSYPPTKAVQAIEAALLDRPEIATRNWTVDETADELVAENISQGVVEP